MKKTSLLLASLVLATALYAQADSTDVFSREDILAVFSQFNPAVLEKASQNPEYQAALAYFLQQYPQQPEAVSQYDLIAAVRNFDNSIALDALTKTYRKLWLANKMSGLDVTPARTAFQTDVTTVLEKVWAVTLNLRQYQLDEAKARLRTLPKSDVAGREQAEAEISALKQEIKELKHNPGEYVTSAAQSYVNGVERDFEKQVFSLEKEVAQEKARAARQTTNLQIKSNHKKPVAK